MGNAKILGSTDLIRIARDFPLTCVDLGARGGIASDLLPISRYVDAIGFEPDQQEWERLDADARTATHRWKSLRYLPIAVGSGATETLHIYRARGCSSLLEANAGLADQYSRGDYFELERSHEVKTVPLDVAAAEFKFDKAEFIKIDIQGYELEVFKSGPRLIGEHVLGIRSEIAFLPVYQEQPLFSEIESFLRPKGMYAMGFYNLQHWRNSTKSKPPWNGSKQVPFSFGQLIHGDVLFLRDASTMRDDTEEGINKLIKTSMLALIFGYVDYAHNMLKRPGVEQLLANKYDVSVSTIVRDVSKYWSHLHRKKSIYAAIKTARGLVKNLVGQER